MLRTGQMRQVPDLDRGFAPAEESRGSGPVRVIPVTPDMQEADRRRQLVQAQPDAVRSAWRARVLGHRATQPAPCPKDGRSSAYEDSRLAARRKRCSGCVRTTDHSSGQCWRCRLTAARAKGAV